MGAMPVSYCKYDSQLIGMMLIKSDDPNNPVIYNVKLRDGDLIEHITIDTVSDDYILGTFIGHSSMTICITRDDIVWIARYN